MAVHVDVADGTLLVRFNGWDRFWAFHRDARVPLDYVTDVRVVDRRDAHSTLGLRLAGSYVPKILTAGLFRTRGGGRQLWCVHRAQNVVAIDLRGQKWDRIVVEVTDPFGTATRIETARRS